MNEKMIDRALEILKVYCEGHQYGCDGCRFDQDGVCFFALCDLPCDWRC